MTCTIAIIENGVTYVGSDSLGSDGYMQSVRNDIKLYKAVNNDNFIIGFSGSYRAGQIIQYNQRIFPDQISSKKEFINNISSKIIKRDLFKEPNVNHSYMVNAIIPKIQAELNAAGGEQLFNGTEKYTPGTFIIAYKDKIYEIDYDYQVAIPSHGFTAIGSGEAVAKGVLYAIQNVSNYSPEEKLIIALQAASEFTVGVKGPYYILNTANNKVVSNKEDFEEV